MKVSGRYTKPGEAPRWVCVEIESEDDAARRILPPAPEGWELEAIVRGDHSEGSDPLEAPGSGLELESAAADHKSAKRDRVSRSRRK